MVLFTTGLYLEEVEKIIESAPHLQRCAKRSRCLDAFSVLDKYIFLTKRYGRTGRISARGTAYLGPIFSQYGPEQAWLRRDYTTEESFEGFSQCPVQYLENIGPAIEHFDWLILVIGPLTV